jgi:hypothetical protein
MGHMFGELLEFNSKEEVNEYIEKMKVGDALTLLEAALTWSQQNGLYTIDESFIIYKSLEKLRQNATK